MASKREQVGTVKVVVRSDDGGNEVKRIPVFEGDDPEVILAEAQANSGRNVVKSEKRQIETPPEHGVQPEKSRPAKSKK